jgi:acyl-coenzyme A thioesterase PaaI-like protein
VTTPASSARVFSFAEVSRVTPGPAGRFTAVVNSEWTVGGRPNGGYLVSMLGRAAVTLAPEHPHPIAVSAHYLRSPDPGPVEIAAEVLRAGRSASQLRASMSQGGRPCVEALLTASTLAAGGAPYWVADVPAAGTVPYEDCPPRPASAPDGFRIAILDQVSIRLEPESAGFVAGRPAGRGELRGWLTLPGDEPFDPLSLVYAVDSFPPATLDIALTGWVPTLELTAYIRALPGPGPVRVLQRVQLIDGQRADETCYVWDSAGRLVAHATQLAAIHLG